MSFQVSFVARLTVGRPVDVTRWSRVADVIDVFNCSFEQEASEANVTE